MITIEKEDVGSWPNVREITNTGLIVSVHHCYNSSENVEVFDVSRKGQAKKIYSFEEVSRNCFLVTGWGDVTYNPRRGFLGAITVEKKTPYHLYNVTTAKAGNIVKLIQKPRWHSQYSREWRINQTFFITDSFNEFLCRKYHH